MTRAEQIPEVVVETWEREQSKSQTTAEAIASTLNAWPRAVHVAPSGGGLSQEPVKDGCLILPLFAEASE